jgi:hypothetical protein
VHPLPAVALARCVRELPLHRCQHASSCCTCLQVLTSAEYEVHYNSNRLGIRLTGPKPRFARSDGGDGGAHPSNVHDHVYAIGTINFTGVHNTVCDIRCSHYACAACIACAACTVADGLSLSSALGALLLHSRYIGSSILPARQMVQPAWMMF